MIKSVLIKVVEECDVYVRPILGLIRPTVGAMVEGLPPRLLIRRTPQTYELHAPYLAGYILRLVVVFIGPPRSYDQSGFLGIRRT